MNQLPMAGRAIVLLVALSSCASGSPTANGDTESSPPAADATHPSIEAQRPAGAPPTAMSEATESSTAVGDGSSTKVWRYDDLPPVDRQVLAEMGIDYPPELVSLEYELRSRLMGSCMSELGFQFDRGPNPADVDPVGHRHWNPLDREYAARYGYHAAPRVSSPANEQANSDPEFAHALFGPDGESGCFGSVMDVVNEGAGVVELADDISALRNPALVAMSNWVATSEYKDLIQAWSICMETLGYDFSSPDEAALAADEQPEPTEAEVETRLADISCDEEVALTAERSRFERDVTQQWAAEHEGEIGEITARIAAAIETLEALLHEHPVE